MPTWQHCIVLKRDHHSQPLASMVPKFIRERMGADEQGSRSKRLACMDLRGLPRDLSSEAGMMALSVVGDWGGNILNCQQQGMGHSAPTYPGSATRRFFKPWP